MGTPREYRKLKISCAYFRGEWIHESLNCTYQKVFVKEQELANSLQINRQNLVKVIDAFNYRTGRNLRVKTPLDSDMEKNFQLKMISDTLQKSTFSSLNVYNRQYQNLRNADNFIFKYVSAYNVTVEKIIDSALKGLIMVQETYNQDIEQFYKGHLTLKNGNDRNYRRADSLQVDDLASMATIAFQFYKYYDNALIYLKKAIDIRSSSSKEYKMFTNNLGERLFLMKKQYTAFHNGLFLKRSNILGPDWKVFPYLVDPGK